LNSAYNLSNLDSSTQYEIINTIALNHTLTILQNHNIIFMNGTSEKARQCADSYAICVAAVTTSAIAGHASCVAADLIQVTGILCHASVFALQMVGNTECSDSFTACMQ